MRRFSQQSGLAWFVAAALSVNGPANAQSSEPSGEWQYSQETGACRAFRTIGAPEDRMFLLLRSFGPGSTIEVTVGNPNFPNEPASARLAEVGWDEMELERDQIALLGYTTSGVPTATFLTAYLPVSSFFKGRVDRKLYAQSSLPAGAETLHFRVAGAPQISLHTGSLQQPLDRLRACESALLERWGWGSDYLQRIASGPTLLEPDSFSYIIAYPAIAVINRIGGILQLRLKVDARGKVAECIVQSSPGSSRFGTDTCKTIRSKIRYAPARNQQGDAVEGFAQVSITFAVLN